MGTPRKPEDPITDEDVEAMQEGELFINETPLMFTTKPEKWGIYFNGENGEPVGRLEFDSHGALTFEGNATNAAEIFFDCVIKNSADKLKEMRELAELGYKVVKDFSPNVGQCVLQDYGAYNDFLMQARAEFGDDEETEG